MTGRRFGATLLCGAGVSVWLFACSSDGDGNQGTPGTGGAAVGGSVGTGGAVGGAVGSGGATNTGGATNAGGATNTGGATSAGGGGPDGGVALYVCEARPPRDPAGSGAVGAACCGGKGTCAATSGKPSLGHDTCGATLLCEPSAATLATGFGACVSKVVTSDPAGVEGRCVPTCFMLGNLQLPVLDNGGMCGADEVCAPCFDAVDGDPTGVCTLKPADAPVQPAPVPYRVCPEPGDAGPGGDAGFPPGGGVCVPETALAPFTDPAHLYYNPSIPGLKQNNCATAEKCVPTAKAADPGHCFAKCTTSDTTVAVGGSDPNYRFGACTPPYVIFDVAGTPGITVSTGGGPCSGGDLCAPCMNPIAAGAPSGSCY